MSGDLWTAWKPKTPESNKSNPSLSTRRSKSEAVQGGDGCAAPDHTRDTFPANCHVDMATASAIYPKCLNRALMKWTRPCAERL